MKRGVESPSEWASAVQQKYTVRAHARMQMIFPCKKAVMRSRSRDADARGVDGAMSAKCILIDEAHAPII